MVEKNSHGWKKEQSFNLKKYTRMQKATDDLRLLW